MTDLEDYRKELDALDRELVALFEKRMQLSQSIGNYKRAHDLPIFDESREQRVVEQNLTHLKSEEFAVQTHHFLDTIMDLSKEVQKDIRAAANDYEQIFAIHEPKQQAQIGYFGETGSFCEEAMLAYFKEAPRDPKNYHTFESLFLGIQNGEIDYGVLPVENSSTGAISQVLDLLYKYGLSIVGEQYIKIEQHLIGLEGTGLDQLEEVYSHPQGFHQSTDYFKDHEQWRQIPFHSTSDSAKMVKDSGDAHKGAIASSRAAQIHGLAILAESIQNQSENTTRFIIVGKDLESNPRCNKVSVVFSLDNQAGTLFKLLRHFARYHINLIKIESRPVEGEKWEYLLYRDFEGNIADENVHEALRFIHRSSVYFRLLGCYKAATENK